MVISVVVFTNAPVLLSLRTTRPVFKENGSIVNSQIHNIVERLALRKVRYLLYFEFASTHISSCS